MLKRCCFCIKLRKACIIIAVLDFLINVVVLNLSGQEFVAHIEQAVAICHCIGCTFLLGGALIKSTILLMFFLITSLTNCLIMTVYCIYQLVNEEPYREVVVPASVIYICIAIYFWLVVYSFYVQVRSPPEVREA
ncbi:uncharacterized protein LOC108106318 isoform X1 [Drosophila eugracilis]|uniref:uncharacterized protein LOC108106318 isoform X1 n=1 Tax=Drosophila eugracilis TaxID=29029 RepID=UPI0007E83C2B|nr:uncharacterized protein LOC108106318 isoform X1 [Drosophila eugracilis]